MRSLYVRFLLLFVVLFALSCVVSPMTYCNQDSQWGRSCGAGVEGRLTKEIYITSKGVRWGWATSTTTTTLPENEEHDTPQ